MKMTRLRLAGFKSFVEPADLLIERGLTGVVGPNGCGKSNLLEALRWVMGESSHKSMRAAAMDDVIFSGTTTRPARQSAEVTIFLDNSQRLAPVEFNQSDIIEVTRRIERDAGSSYRINAREARARDVRILFEDAATGARSPALVRQGQIAEIVNAQPHQRKRILEDAAGVAGLHSRRHDAELRLKAAEANLARVADVVGGLNAQLEGLRRQARSARRYKDLSTEIRRLEVLSHHFAYAKAQASVEAEEAAQGAVLMRLATAVEAESRAVIVEAQTAEAIGPLRRAGAERAAASARLKAEADEIARELARVTARQLELATRAGDLSRDLAREEALAVEAGAAIARLDGELATLDALDEASEADGAAAVAGVAAIEAERDAADAHLAILSRAAAEARAHALSHDRAKAECAATVERLTRLTVSLGEDQSKLAAGAPDAARLHAAHEAVARLTSQLAAIEAATPASESLTRAAATSLRTATQAAAEARLTEKALATERATLERLIGRPGDPALPPLLDLIRVAPGFEAALGAALGDDLEAPLDDSAPSHWREVDSGAPAQSAHADPALPVGAAPLMTKVDAPPVLTRRLRQIGIVSRGEGTRQQQYLAPGQRLVSIEGDLWRWDGFVASAHQSAATQRLALRNRLKEVQSKAHHTLLVVTGLQAAESVAHAALTAADTAERALRQQARETLTELARARDAAHADERTARAQDARLEAIAGRLAHTGEELRAAQTRHDSLLATPMPVCTAASEAELARHMSATAALRTRAAEARAAAATFAREAAARREHHARIVDDRRRWQARATGASAQAGEFGARLIEVSNEAAALASRPAELDLNRQKVLDALSTTADAARTANDALADAEASAKTAREWLKTVSASVTAEKELKARGEARLESARTSRQNEARAIREAFEVAPLDCLALAGFPADAALPSHDEASRQLARARSDRERLGGVNLTAEDELGALAAQSASLQSERADVEQAIAKLRGAIGQLNREAKKRLDEAFHIVDGHFQRLFSVLFDGGEARLAMIESEDPMEGGLEIIAKPPGKKPATLSLLSGGEQTLTALSLIFAVFLTNPSPICVLDEVDAPLDDANVDRFATMMETMAQETETRFLVITHHPMTMARMNRLFGVTMSERGVSQLVSVDLETARGFQEATAA